MQQLTSHYSVHITVTLWYLNKTFKYFTYLFHFIRAFLLAKQSLRNRNCICKSKKQTNMTYFALGDFFSLVCGQIRSLVALT